MAQPQPLHKAVLRLQDGTEFHGLAAGAQATVTGELCFNTAMAGYQETFSDPSYTGQMLVMTHAHIGNYGIIEGESESKGPTLRALICRNYSGNQTDLRPGSQALDPWLSEAGVPVIYNIDTRALVRKLRRAGSLNALVSTEDLSEETRNTLLAQTPDMQGLALVNEVTVSEPTDMNWPSAGPKIAVLDLGHKAAMLRLLTERGARLRIFPAHTDSQEILAWEPDGFLITNGPGDPEPLQQVIETTRKLIATDKPMLGICLGHQIIALAMGIPTYKMKHGHRGVNHPVLHLTTGRGEITSQNHGFAVDAEALARHPDMELTHRHLNDGTVAGMRHRSKPTFCVQYHPEAHPGPHDSRYLFDDFMDRLSPRPQSWVG